MQKPPMARIHLYMPSRKTPNYAVISPILPFTKSALLRNYNQQNQNNNQYHNNRQTPILLRFPAEPFQSPPRPIKLCLVPIDTLFHIVEQQHLSIQLIAYLHTQLPLPSDALTQPIQLVILIPNYLAVVFVDLLVVKTALVGNVGI